MTYLANGIQEKLQQAFTNNGFQINVQSDHIIVESSENQTEEKVRQIVTSAGFFPLISDNKINRNIAFSIMPYTIPDFFIGKDFSIVRDKTPYFSKDEISRLLECAVFVDKQEESTPKDKWSRVNDFRSYVTPALNKGLSEILLQHIRNEHPLIEIGSGIGYTLPDTLSSKTIRFQPRYAECQLLKKTIADPLYQLDIEGFYNCVSKNGKKIPLFFALDVFDTMSPVERTTSFSQISNLQCTGDKILILLDTNPCFEVITEHLETLHPGHIVLPYFPLSQNSSRISVIMVPSKFVPFKPSHNDLIGLIETETMGIMKGYVSEMQFKLHQLQEKHDLKVIILEDFFVEQIKNDLKQTGYNANTYYHAAFTTGEPPKGLSKINEDLVYKSVTDTATLRQWSLSDENLFNWLAGKKLALPSHFDEAFLCNLRSTGQKIFGAEILVIEATKN